MARPDVQSRLRLHHRRFDALETLCAHNGTAALRAAAEALAEKETEKILVSIPVEELNREAPGLRTAALRAAGFESFADLRRASLSQISAAEGISEESAALVKRHINIYASTDREGLRLRLSADEGSPETDRLVAALWEHKARQTQAAESQALLHQYRPGVENHLRKLAPAESTFRWLTASPAARKAVFVAIGALEGLEAGDYARRCRDLMDKELPKPDPETAWAHFVQDAAGNMAFLDRLCPGLFGGVEDPCGLPEELSLSAAQQPLATEGLQCRLRRYQEWGLRYILQQKRVLLGDEMALARPCRPSPPWSACATPAPAIFSLSYLVCAVHYREHLRFQAISSVSIASIGNNDSLSNQFTQIISCAGWLQPDILSD